ncbi:MAG: mechanosensitive ion channel domain-containing protein [Porticoccus sp.]
MGNEGQEPDMLHLEGIYQTLAEFVPLLATIAVVVLALRFADWLLVSRASLTTKSRLPGQVAMMLLTAVALISIVLALPVNESTRSDLLGLLGLVLTGVIALSSTTFVSNAMAGLMLRSVQSFRHGDFIRAGDHFGRVTERGLFHTEIQSEDRDLITLPNLYLASSPVTVVRSSGTIISCELTLGYDVPHHQVELLLKEAAVTAGLQEPFIQIMSLGDFSIAYKISGYYAEVKHLLTARSRLRREVLDKLHGADIEIVSPAFMNQRQFTNGEKFMAAPKERDPLEVNHKAPESLIFDKADRAEKVRVLKDESQSLVEEIKQLKEQLEGLDEPQVTEIKAEIFKRKERIEKLDNIIRIAKDSPNE